MFISIQNGQISNRSFILQPRIKSCEIFLKILWKEGLILGYEIFKKDKEKLKIFLKYNGNKSVINNIRLISKPGRRIFYSSNDIWKINFNNSIIIFFTTKGIKSNLDCKKYKIGGEPLILIT